jgi:hypothetical protein
LNFFWLAQDALLELVLEGTVRYPWKVMIIATYDI